MADLSLSLKAICLVAFILPGASQPIEAARSNTLRPALCDQLSPYVVDQKRYRQLTQNALRKLGQTGDPVGLYYLAQEDLRAGLMTEAMLKLQRAGQQGLASAWDQLAALHHARGDRQAAREAKLCAQTLWSRSLG